MESRNMSIHSVSAQTRQPHAVWRSVLRVVSLMIIFVALLYAKTAYNSRQAFALVKMPTHTASTNGLLPIMNGRLNGIPR